MDAINRQELARLMAHKVDGLSQRVAAAALDAALDAITETLLRGGAVRLHDFGTFSTRHRPTRQVRHPKTRELLIVPAQRVTIFAPSAALRTQLGGLP